MSYIHLNGYVCELCDQVKVGFYLYLIYSAKGNLKALIALKQKYIL